MTWQDIDTAPKDGRDVLVVADGFVMMAYFDDDSWWAMNGFGLDGVTHWFPVPEPWQDIDTAPKDGRDVLVVADGFVMMAYFDDDSWWAMNGFGLDGVTHWFPVPEPPKEEE